MTTPAAAASAAQPTGDRPPLPFPDCVPVLVDRLSGVLLRAHTEDDLAAIVEQSADPASQWATTVPTPAGGYSLSDAREFATVVIPAGWAADTMLGWAIEAQVDGRRQFCGTIDLRIAGDGTAEVGFGLHPAARGRSVMSTALRLVRDYGFDVRGLAAIRWRARVGNWASRRVAAAAGFRFDGTVRLLLSHRGELLDGWLATITATDPRLPLPWLDPPVLPGRRLVLRPFTESDVDAIVQACSDPRTRQWLVSLPTPYERQNALDFVEVTRELAAQRHSLTWCVADVATDSCLGCVSLDGFGGYSRRTEIGYWAHPGARGSGLMTEAVRLVTDYAEQNQLTDSITIRCAVGNVASQHVAESAGYTRIGVLPRSEPVGDGSVVDLAIYSRP